MEGNVHKFLILLLKEFRLIHLILFPAIHIVSEGFSDFGDVEYHSEAALGTNLSPISTLLSTKFSKNPPK